MKQAPVFPLQKSRPVESQNGVQSVSRALDLLEAFPRYGPELGLSRIAGLLYLNKATAYRLLSTLEERGYVERLPESRKYRLGVRAFELGLLFPKLLEVRRRPPTCGPSLRRLVRPPSYASARAMMPCASSGSRPNARSTSSH
jgi:hypothetical protein